MKVLRSTSAKISVQARIIPRTAFLHLTFKVGDQEYFNERPISTQQSGFVFVAQMRSELPDAIGGVLWFGTDDANMTVFTPVYCCVQGSRMLHPCGRRRLHHFLLELRFLDFQLGGQYGISAL